MDSPQPEVRADAETTMGIQVPIKIRKVTTESPTCQPDLPVEIRLGWTSEGILTCDKHTLAKRRQMSIIEI